MSRWFRHYAGMMRDDKLVRVAIKSKQTVERVVWIYGAILESAAEIDDDGRYDLDSAEIAYFLRADEADVDAVLVALGDAGRVVEGRVVKWGSRQFSSDRSRDRVAAHRERKRSQGVEDNGEVEAGNGVVTLPIRPRNAPETELETELDKKEEATASSASDDAPGLKPIHVFEKWNEVAKRVGKSTVRDLTPSRQQLVRARIGQYSLEDFVVVFGKVEASNFLREGRFCTFDWIMKRANFQKIIEGNYDDEPVRQVRQAGRSAFVH